MKYKPCCGYRCMVGGCETNKAGGCYCLCRIFDGISSNQQIIDGYTIIYPSGVCVYSPHEDRNQERIDRMTVEEKTFYDNYRTVVAAERKKSLEDKVKEYEIKE